MHTIFDQAGIYAIENSADGRVYIGSTIESFHERWRLHKRDLRRGVHRNRFLQHAWNKYGEIAFSLRVLEVITDKSAILQAEQRWLDHYRAQGNCYNLAPTAGNNAGLRWSDESRDRAARSAQQRISTTEGQNHLARLANNHAKTYPGFIAPDGTLYAPVTNLKAFCEQHGLNDGAMHRLHRRIVKRHHGWTRYEGDIPPADMRLAHANAKTYLGFIAPDGIEHRNITNLSAFCRKHGLSQPSMSDIARGRKKVHRGWTALHDDDQGNDQID